MRARDFFDRTYAIHLPGRRDRRRDLVAELERVGLALEAGRVELFEGVRPSEAAGFPSVGARGCFLSHLGVLRRARELGLSRVLVLEDDVQFTRSFGDHQEAWIAQLEARPWGLAWLGHEGDGPASATPVLRPFRDELTQTHCYAVQGIFGELVDCFEEMLRRPVGHPLGSRVHVDGAYNLFLAQHSEVTRLLAGPSLARQRSSASDVAERRWFDRVPGVSHLAGGARRLRNAARRGR